MRLLTTLANGHALGDRRDRVRRPRPPWRGPGEGRASGHLQVRAVLEILDAVERERNGLPVMSRADRDGLIADYHEARESHRELRAKFALMTRREAEVLGQLMAGKQVTEIAHETRRLRVDRPHAGQGDPRRSSRSARS